MSAWGGKKGDKVWNKKRIIKVNFTRFEVFKAVSPRPDPSNFSIQSNRVTNPLLPLLKMEAEGSSEMLVATRKLHNLIPGTPEIGKI
jgi:hypothetical protein